ncbi:MAG: hypothetical protein JWM19_6115 [Actinomycetia bacterium]|nr:hypothetical protein [Actinomycetes bacterium]
MTGPVRLLILRPTPLAGQRLPDRGVPGHEHSDLLPEHLAAAVRGCAWRAAFAGGQPAAWYGYLRELGLPVIAAACARRAARKASDIPDPWPRADAQADAAIAFATAARTGEALDCAGRIGVASAQVRALAGIAVVIASAAPATAATQATAETIARQSLDVARTAGFPGWRPDALAMATEALAAAGLGAEAAEVAASISDPWARAEAYAHAVAALGTDLDAPAALIDAAIAQALAATSSVGNRSWRAEAKAAIVDLLCHQGQLPRAHDVAASIDDPVWRADGMLALATYSPDYAEAHELFCEAVRLGGLAGYQWWQSRRLARALAMLLWSAPGDPCLLAAVAQLRSHPAILVATARELATRPHAGGDRAWFRVLGALATACGGAGRPSAGLTAPYLSDVHATGLLAACATAVPGNAPGLRRLALASSLA